MADKIDNTEVTQQTVAGRAQQRDVTWLLRVTLPACESNDPTDLPGITVGFSRYACREKSPLNPAASTKTPKLLGTLSDPLSLSAAGLPWQGPLTVEARSFPTSNLQRGLSLTVERFREIVFLVDTPVGIEKGFSPSESATSRKLSRYTFDMFGKGVFIA